MRVCVPFFEEELHIKWERNGYLRVLDLELLMYLCSVGFTVSGAKMIPYSPNLLSLLITFNFNSNTRS